jgi:uncharacterized radical SAM protein YgiQ
MAERALLETALRLQDTGPPDLRGIAGSVFVGGEGDLPAGAELLHLPSHEAIEADPLQLVRATLDLERQVHRGCWARQSCGGRSLILAPPAAPLTTAELDALHALPFSRLPHPGYCEPIPAAEMIRFSITSHRGCGGGCSFCSLALHQGRQIRSRSPASIRDEAARLTRHPLWRGSISDVGGPTANLWGASCATDRDGGRCERTSCLFPAVCPNLAAPQQELADLLLGLRDLPGVRHVRVASGVRHDLALDSPGYLQALVHELTGGQLKLAPEHICHHVLRLMRKPPPATFRRFLARFERESQRAGRRQYVVPYLISAFPGCTDADMRQLARWLAHRGWKPRQVQCFVPTPGTLATAMYHAGVDPGGRPIPVARTDAERLRQHRILTGSPRRRR